MRKILMAAAVALACGAAQAEGASDAMLKQISAQSLRGHLSFIASDLLEGRGTPSRGQDIAAEYIAAQFRRAGLEPLGDDEYFQTAKWNNLEPDLAGFTLKLGDLSLTARQASFAPGAALDLKAGLVKVDFKETTGLERIAGKVVFTEFPTTQPRSQAEYDALRKDREEFMARLAANKAVALISLNRVAPNGNAGGTGKLVDPEAPAAKPEAVRTLHVHGADAAKLFDALPTNASAELKLAAFTSRPVKLRNVAGVLRGSDPALKDTYVMLTAHYDHLGIKNGVIHNGANDDGSGTVSVIEIAHALAGMSERPKRSIVFMTVFGEELGLVGSRYYGRHPLVPLAKTVADVNIEQVGRTDDSEGPQIKRAAMTGFDFTDIGPIFAKAGTHTGVTVFKHAANSDRYFAQSDNQALADAGVPAHTLSVAYEFPDYHKGGDHWQKIDYDNMASVDRMIALGTLMIANDPKAPQWNAANPKVSRYVGAQKSLTK